MEKIFSEHSPPFKNLPCRVKHFPLKRLFDIAFSIAFLLFFSPLYAVIALIIRLSSPGKIIYHHERVGRGGSRFHCYKFRTMYADADLRLAEILEKNPRLHQEWKEIQKLKNDPRVTPIGKVLRKFSLDELPQFWNVIKGDLSVVGPRPVLPVEIEKYFGPKAIKILSVRPGITGIWQVSGRSNTTYAERIALDERYINERNFLFDLVLILKTIPAMISSKGSY